MTIDELLDFDDAEIADVFRKIDARTDAFIESEIGQKLYKEWCEKNFGTPKDKNVN
jgi:hypothetical protein